MKASNDKMEQRAVRALQRTWDAIGYDALQVAVDVGEASNIDDVVMTRAEVIDMVTSCGFVGGYPMDHGDDREAVQWLEDQSERTKKRI